MSWVGSRGRLDVVPLVNKNKRDYRQKAPKRLYRLGNTGVNTYIGCHAPNSQNFRVSVFERVLTVRRDGENVETYRPDETFYRDRMSAYVDELRRKSYTVEPVSWQEFVQRYSGRKLLNYQRALTRLVHLHSNGILSYRELSSLGNFIKVEKLFVTKLLKAPRNISPRKYEYNILLGRYIAHLEKRLFGILTDVCGFPVVFKGMNALAQGKQMRKHWEQFDDPVAVDIDASRFDQHQHVAALRVEHDQWIRMVPSEFRQDLRDILNCQLKNHGSCMFREEGVKVKYSVEGTRASGDMNTSSGNCFTMVGLCYSYLQPKGIKWRLANNGDDCVLILERKDINRINDLPQWFYQMGFTMEVGQIVDQFEQIQFCQTQPVWTPDGYVMVRQPDCAIVKDITTRCDLRRRDVFESWSNAMHHGGRALAGNIPIYTQFYNSYLPNNTQASRQELQALEDTGFWKLSQGMRNDGIVHPRTRVSFMQAFGVTPPTQRQLEAYFSKLKFEFSEAVESNQWMVEGEGGTVSTLLSSQA